MHCTAVKTFDAAVRQEGGALCRSRYPPNRGSLRQVGPHTEAAQNFCQQTQRSPCTVQSIPLLLERLKRGLTGSCGILCMLAPHVLPTPCRAQAGFLMQQLRASQLRIKLPQYPRWLCVRRRPSLHPVRHQLLLPVPSSQQPHAKHRQTRPPHARPLDTGTLRHVSGHLSTCHHVHPLQTTGQSTCFYATLS